MVTNKRLQMMIGLAASILFLAGCGGAPTEPALEATPIQPAATAVPPAATPIQPTATPVPATATVPATAEAQGDLQPLSEVDCIDLADAMSRALSILGDTVVAPFEDYISGKSGAGCQTTVIGTGNDFQHVGVIADTMTEMLQAQGWQEDINYAGGGPGGLIAGFRKANGLCLLVVSSGPSDEGLCSDDEPFGACWERLTPEQRIFTITLNCTQDTAAPPEPKRIQFAPGAASAQVLGSLAASGIDRYVLAAMAGQEMTVNLLAALSGDPATVSSILVIWGEDGTVLISDHADATNWMGELPLSQDYYIDVKSVAQVSVDYALDVLIAPATGDPTQAPEGSEGRGNLPREVPPSFQPVVAQLESTGVPLMLPPDFPVGKDLPPIHPYFYTVESGEYEISLDFGADCRGAGACHYGSLTGKKVDSNAPVGTRNFVFEAERAQKVTLVNDIEAYFIESRCGANCDDAKVFWIYNGIQYMVGLKGGRQSDVLNLANATIENSIP